MANFNTKRMRRFIHKAQTARKNGVALTKDQEAALANLNLPRKSGKHIFKFAAAPSIFSKMK